MRWFLAAVIALASTWACVPAQEYHAADPVTRLPAGDGVKADDSISLAYVEFDDNGELYDRNEIDQAVQRIQDLQRPGGIDIVVFVHGWKNDADNSGNVNGFQRFLREVSRRRSHDGTAPTRPLIGVYMAWRGASLKLGQNLTYWNRSLATTRVAGPHFEEALFRIMRASKDPKTTSSARQNTLIVIGHSFGGRVLEHAITPYFETLLLQASGTRFGHCELPSDSPGDTVTGPWPDLTVLLNEAAPATDAKAFLETLACHDVKYRRTDASGRSVSLPLILSFTSDGDSATGIALPAGQWLARTQMASRNYKTPAADAPWEGPAAITSQSTYFTHSAAHIPALHSHTLLTMPSASSSSTVCAAPVAFDQTQGPVISVGRDMQRAHGQRQDTQPIYRYELCPVGTVSDPKAPTPYWNHTPYWIFKIPIEIVPDHSDIFRNELFDFLTFFIPEAGATGTLTVR